MSAIAQSKSRIFSIISRSNRRFSSNVTTEPPKEPIISSSSLLKDQPPPPQNQSPPNSEASGTEKSRWSFLKYSVIAAITGGVATAGYATYGWFFYFEKYFGLLFVLFP